MHQTSYNAYNAVMNALARVAHSFYAMALSFKETGSEGFAGMLFNESSERWHMSKGIACYLIKAGMTPMLDAIPKPSGVFPTPVDALTSAEKMDMDIIAALDAGIRSAVANDPAEIMMMSKKLKKLRKEHNEVLSVRKKLSMPGASIAEIDFWLIDKYGNPCGR